MLRLQLIDYIIYLSNNISSASSRLENLQIELINSKRIVLMSSNRNANSNDTTIKVKSSAEHKTPNPAWQVAIVPAVLTNGLSPLLRNKEVARLSASSK